MTGHDWLQLLTLADYNIRLVTLSVTLLGISSATVGTIMLLRKQALAGDTISHAMLPGICLAFLFMLGLTGSGKYLPGLLLGGLLFGLLGMGCFYLLLRLTKLKDDAALGIVLSVFFGAGVALLSYIQNLPQANAAGLESFIYGKTASMVTSDSKLIAWVSLLSLFSLILCHKELRLLAFDPAYGRVQGWPVAMLDTMLLLLVILITVVGLQAVGLILMVALLVIPPAAARFWTQSYHRTMVIAAIIGGVSCALGAMLSATFQHLPAGAIMVVLNGCLFAISFLCGPQRGLLPQSLAKYQFERKIALQHLLRAAYEYLEESQQLHVATRTTLPWNALKQSRSWSQVQFKQTLQRAQRDNLVGISTLGALQLTELGWQKAQRLVRNHRLWEIYLIEHADVAPSHVDRDADSVEHVLGGEMVAELLHTLGMQADDKAVPPSPHQLGGKYALE